MRLRETVNEYGTPVVEYRCETCGETFTVCPAPREDQDDQWTGCTATHCGSYDPARDADRLFDGPHRAVDQGDGSTRVTPFGVIDGGRP